MTGKWTQSDWQQIMETAVSEAFPTIGMTIEGQAVELAPYLTGRLRGSITYATQKQRSRPRSPANQDESVSTPGNIWTLHVGSNVNYAEYVEYGTKHIAAQPYLRPALDWGRKPAQRIFAAAIEKAVKQYGK